jgi:hypothetical protein
MTQEEIDARAALIAAMQPKTFEERYAEMLKAASIIENIRAKAKWGMIPTKAQRAAWKLRRLLGHRGQVGQDVE